MTVELTPTARCCPSHSDWTTLFEHLVVAYPDFTPEDVLRQLVDAKSVTGHFGLDAAGALDMAEVMARQHLSALDGTIIPTARA